MQKTVFCKTSNVEPCLEGATGVQISIQKSVQKMNSKQACEKKCPPESKKSYTELIPKSPKNQNPDPRCPSCCSHGPPGCPQVQKWYPKVPNPRHQASQMTAFGTRNGVKGPAAQGIALKVTSNQKMFDPKSV